MKKSLPLSTQKIIDHYANLSLGGKKVITPYFMNEKSKKGRRVSVGKGTPEEIEKETTRFAKKYGFNLQEATAESIRTFMIQHELGIDCSGFVTWVVNELVKEKVHQPIWKTLSYRMLSPLAQIKRLLRPVENTSVRVLTHQANSISIPQMIDIHIGDMIRIFNGHHILLITEITYDKKNNPIVLKYVNSTMTGQKLYGILTGTIQITKPEGSIIEQKWMRHAYGSDWNYKAAKDYCNDTRIVRLKVLM
jgi:hypothetical protein